MAQNEQIVEVVRFTETGLEQMAANAKALADNTGALKTKFGEYADTVQKAARRNEQFARAVKDGTYDRHVRQMRALNDQYERLRQRADAIARLGPRLGAIMSNPYVRGAARVGMYAGGAALAAGAGLARSGFGGTVESNRLSLETELLGREVAGAMKPFTDGITNATVRLRKWMEGLSASGQDMVMYGGLLATGLVGLRALVGASAFGSLASGAVSAVSSPMAFLSANRRGIAGAAGLGLWAYGSATGHRGMGAAGGALTGYAVGGPWGAAIGGTVGAVEASGDYGRYRDSGRSAVASAGLALMSNLSDLGDYFTGGDSTERWRKEMDAFNAKKKKAEADRRMVTKADAGFEAVGSGYDRLSTALALVDASAAAAREEAATTGGMGGLTAAMERLTEAVRAASADPMYRPAAAPAGGTS